MTLDFLRYTCITRTGFRASEDKSEFPNLFNKTLFSTSGVAVAVSGNGTCRSKRGSKKCSSFLHMISSPYRCEATLNPISFRLTLLCFHINSNRLPHPTNSSASWNVVTCRYVAFHVLLCITLYYHFSR
jgi:hypothetical protein